MHKAADRGFTLIEMLVAMVVLSILVGIATPSFNEFIAAQRVKRTATDLVTDLLKARDEAIDRGVAVTVGPINPATWNTGWKIYSGATTIKQRDIALNSIAAVTIGVSPNEVTFAPNGRSSNTATFMLELTPVAGSVTLNKRCIKVDSASGVKTLKAACS